jgi:uncharacterized protein
VIEMDKPANSRDQHLFGPGYKRILSLDGGGVRGIISVAFLLRIEKLLRERFGQETRLGDHFDCIGGTSTGAIIACGLALGHSADQLKDFYMQEARLAFQRRRWVLPLLQSKFDDRMLRQQIEKVVGSRTLDTEDLITGFCLIAKRMDTGSPWIISNDPRAPFWEDAPDHIGNRHYPLANIVRASTAAPHYFDPELLPILPDSANRAGTSTFGLFVDGGVSPYNNPALALFQLTTFKAFGIRWPTGVDRLGIVSVGTGTYRERVDPEGLGLGANLKLAFHALQSMMRDSEAQALTLLQWMGESPQPWIINSEIGTLAEESPPGGKLFHLLRYDVHLEENWLKSELGVSVTPERLLRWRQMDDASFVDALFEIGGLAAERQVRLEHWTA